MALRGIYVYNVILKLFYFTVLQKPVLCISAAAALTPRAEIICFWLESINILFKYLI